MGKARIARWALLAAAVWAAGLLLGACADTGPGHAQSQAAATQTWTTLTSAGGLFAVNCQGCHPFLHGPDLSSGTAAYTTLVTNGEKSTEVPALKLIDTGHSTSSYLFMKMVNAAGITGTVMPPGGQLSTTDTDEVGAWIDAGAPQ